MHATLSRCRLCWLLIPLIGAVLAPVPCFASEDNELSETEVVVTATRRRQAKQTASAAVTVITRAEIAASGAPTVAEVLRGAAGIDIPRQGPLGAAALPSLRGSSAGQVLVLVDGRRLNSPQHGDVDLSDIAIENVERIEVVRGGASALYGSDAVGGVINIITRAPSGEPEVRLSQGYGSFNTQLLSGLYSGSTGRLRYALTAQRTSATNDFEYFDAQAGREQTRNNAGYHSWDASVKLVADLGASRQLTFSAERSDAERRTCRALPRILRPPQSGGISEHSLISLPDPPWAKRRHHRGGSTASSRRSLPRSIRSLHLPMPPPHGDGCRRSPRALASRAIRSSPMGSRPATSA